MRQPSYFEHLSTVLDEVADRGLADLAARPGCCAPRRRTSPTTSSRPTSTSTAAPSTAPPSCGPAGSAASAWSRARSARRSARSTSPGTSRRRPRQQMDELVANLLAAYRESIAPLDWMTEETKARAYEKLDTFRPKIGYPEKFRDYSALRIRPDDLLGNVAARGGVRDRPPARQDRLAGRPRRVVHAAADRQRLLQPRHQRDLLPGRDPAEAVLQPRRRRRPRTTAASARSSATRSATASTTRARSTTAPATSTTGGRPTTRPPSR